MLAVSRWASVALLLLYAAFLYFQLATHRDLFDTAGEGGEGLEEFLGFWGCIAWLALLTGGISLMSDCLVGALDGARRIAAVAAAPQHAM